MTASVRVVLVEIDYQQETTVPGPVVPVTATLYLATKEYFDDAAGIVYSECINSVPNYSRSLSGERLGNYSSTIGSVEIDNADGEFDSILGRALDGSAVRVYIGDASWLRIDFQLMFSALATKAVAPSLDRISIQLKDATSFLNKSISGVKVSGTGPNKDRTRPINFGYVHQVEALVYDETTLTYVHSDTDDLTSAQAVRDNGLDVNFADNGDGTFYLDQSPVNPTGGITVDVLAVAPGSPADVDERRFSNAMRYLIGERAGLAAAGVYEGALASFTPGDDDDYFVGVSITESRNVIDLLNELVDSGNAFWAITRLGQFVYGRLNPHDLVDGSPSTAVEIEADDIDDGTLKIDHTSPLYYKLQAYMSRNWSQQSVLATGMEPDQRAFITRKGLYAIQPDSETDDYASSPQLYSLSLTVSPPIETLLSGNDDETDVDALQLWMERRRTMFLPWIETLSFTVGMEFFELEIGDTVRLTMARFDLDNGELFQVVGIDLQLTKGKVALQIMRRRASEFVPFGFERQTADTTRLITGIKIPQPPPLPKPPEPAIFINPFPPITVTGGGGVNVIYSGEENLFWWDTFTVGPRPFRFRQSFRHGALQLRTFEHSCAMNSAGTFAVVGAPNNFALDGGSLVGHVMVFEKSSAGRWRHIADIDTLNFPHTDDNWLGANVTCADNGTFVASQLAGFSFHIYERTGPTSWSHTQFDPSYTLAYPDVVINRDGNVIVWQPTIGEQFFQIYKKSGGVWSLQQTVNIAPDFVWNVDISADGETIVVACSDTLNNATMRVYRGNFSLTAWSLWQNITPTSENGNTGDGRANYMPIALAAGAKNMIAHVAMDDQHSSQLGGTIFLYKRNASSGLYSQICYLRSTFGTFINPGGQSIGLGVVDLSDDGKTLYVGASWDDPVSPFSRALGRAWFYDGVHTIADGGQPAQGGGVAYIEDHFTEIPNPYGTTAGQHFGSSIAGTRSDVVVVSATNNIDGLTSIDFYRR